MSGERFTGPRARVATAAVFVAGVLAACQPGAEAQKPTIQPTGTENPTPSLTVTSTPSASIEASPSINPAATPEITPSSTPEASLVPIGDLVNQIIDKAGTNGWTKGTEKNIISSINNAYANDPEAAAIVNPALNTPEKDVVTDKTNPCFTSNDHTIKRVACAGLVGHLYWKGYKIDGNKLWLTSIDNVVYYAHTNLNAQDFNAFKNNASNQKSPF